MIVHVLYFFALAVFALVIIGVGYFDTIDVSQILFHVLHIESLFVVSFSWKFLFCALFIFCSAYLWLYILVIKKIGKRENIIISVFLFFISVLFFLLYFDFSGYFSDRTFYEDNYVSVDFKDITFSNSKKNLIVLYLESLEETYKNEELWGENLLPGLSLLQEKYVRLGEFVQMPGTGWTMAAFMASNCGVPVFYGDNEGFYRTYTGKRFQNNICLPDILSAAGYSQYHIIGSDRRFTDFDGFFEIHAPNATLVDVGDFGGNVLGNFWVRGNEEILKYGLKDWGIRDSVLYEKAKMVISEAALRPPFYVSIQTLDTHSPAGYLDEKCENKYGDYRDIIKCADRMATEFIDWVVAQEWFDNTNVLVIGDHLGVITRFGGVSLRGRNDRRIFNLLVSKDVIALDDKRVFATMDVFPTLLALAGGSWETERLALGTSLLSPEKYTLSEMFGANLFERKIQRKSFMYNKMYKGKQD